MLKQRLSEKVEKFVAAALPLSHWGETYFNIRLMEFELADGLFNGVFSGGKGAALDIGCGIGLASVYLSDFFDRVDGTDIDEVGVAFNVKRAAPLAGAEIIGDLGLRDVRLHCGDTLDFLRARPARYDLIFSHFVLEHVEHLESLVAATYESLKPGGRALHIVPNTHDTIVQLLLANLDPLWENLKRAWRNRGRKDRCDVRRMGNLFAPITHSEFLSDYRKQFEVNAAEHYLFPMIAAGFKVRDIKPMREHAYGILIEKPVA